MKSISARIYSMASYRKNEEIELIVELINDSARTVLISKKLAEAFEDGKKEKKIGKTSSMPKKNRDRSGLYKLRPHSHTLKKVNLPASFADSDVEKEIRFRLSVLNPHFEKAKNSSVVKKIQTRSIKTKLVIGKPWTGILKITPRVSSLVTSPTDMTMRELAEELPPFVQAPERCEIIGGSPQQQVEMNRAHEAGYALAYNALQRLRNDNDYQTWFGAYEEGRFRIVRGALMKIVDDFQNKTFTYDLRSQSSGDDIGYAEYENYTIKFFSRFWHLKNEGRGSKASRVLHEHSHVSANTLDSAYTRAACLSKARNFPDQAVENANNYQFFAES